MKLKKSTAIKRDSKRKSRRDKDKVLKDFYDNILTNQKDCPDWALETTDKHFWELL